MMAGINLGMVFGSAVTTGFKTYGELQQLQQQAATFKQQQDQWAREDQERQAAAVPQSNTTAVTPATLAQQMQGSDGKADPDAVMGTYGAVQDPTQAPSVSKNIVQGGIAQGQMANAAAGQGPQQLAYQGPAPAGQPPAAQPVNYAPANGIPGGEGNIAAATQYVRGEEGGYVANDNGKGPTNMGINGQANGLTRDQVAKLTPDQVDRMYRDRYFTGQNGGVDIRGLPQPAAVAVADTAANMGQGTAAKLWDQSGGDLSKFLDLRQKEYDSIKADPNTHAAWNMRMSHIRDFVNQHGTSETGGADGAPPVAPDSKVTELHAAPISTVGIGDNVKFTHDENGNLQMTKGDTNADALQRMANKAFQTGDLKNGPQLMKMALDMRAQESQAQVTKIMTDQNMNADDKVAQLAKLAGMQAYKTEQGNYLIPGLGPTDSKGNPMPMTAPQVGALASQLATPEGLSHVIETQMAFQKMAQADKELGIKQQTADAETSKAAAAQTTANADAGYKGKIGEYYGAEKNAIIGEKNAKAAKEQEDTNLKNQLTDIQNKVAALDPKAPDYTQQLNHLRAQAQILGQRITGKFGDAPKNEKLEDNTPYVDANGVVSRVVPGAGLVPETEAPRVTAGMQEMAAKPDVYKGMVVAGKSSDGAHWGFALHPTVAGDLAGKMYPTPQAAIAAFRARLKNPGQGGLGTPAPNAVIPPGIPVANNPTAAVP